MGAHLAEAVGWSNSGRVHVAPEGRTNIVLGWQVGFCLLKEVSELVSSIGVVLHV